MHQHSECGQFRRYHTGRVTVIISFKACRLLLHYCPFLHYTLFLLRPLAAYNSPGSHRLVNVYPGLHGLLPTEQLVTVPNNPAPRLPPR